MNRLILAIAAALAFGGCKPALHKAVQEGDAARVQELLNEGADVNVRETSNDRLQYTPLHWAAFLGNQSIVRLLISRGGDVEAKDPWYSTPLYLAAEQGHVGIVESLLSLGAEVNVKSEMLGYTPLHRAAWGPVVTPRSVGKGNSTLPDMNENYLKIVRMLLEKGAKVNERDKEGETPLDHAKDGGTDEIVALLIKAGAKSFKDEEKEEAVAGVKMSDYEVGALTVRFRSSELSKERKNSPWTGYGVDGGHPDTVIHSLDVSDGTGSYSVPGQLVNDLGNPNIQGVRTRQTGNLLDLAMTNSDGAGGHHVLFQINTAEYKVRRFVRKVIDEDMSKTHDWTPLRKRRSSWKKADE